MKKGYSPSDLPQQEGQDQAKRLHRSISENARRLDDVRGCARAIAELFTPSLLAQRNRLRENCERLIFLDPILYGRKGEELLWRKVYYDVVSTSKRLKKLDYSIEDIAHLQYHISSGIGYYHHFIARLQIEFNLNLLGIIDFPVTVNEISVKQVNSSDCDILKNWAEQSVHRCLIYLGDLSRYKLEIYPNWDHGLATRYYLQAFNFKPEYGMPHNQLGTLSSGMNCHLDATYHYMRCLCCEHVFEGTENNLLRLLEKNSHSVKNLTTDPNDYVLEPGEHIKRFISRFLVLVEILYFEKKNANVHSLCHQVLIDLKNCLRYSNPLASESGDSPINLESCENDSVTCPNYLNSDIILKMVVICLMCIMKLQKIESKQISAMKAFILAVYSHLTQNIIEHIQSSVFNISVPSPEPEEMKNGMYKKRNKKVSKMRRRRIKTNCEDSDLSESESVSEESSSSTPSSGSETEPVSSESESSESEHEKTVEASVNGHNLDVNGKSKSDQEEITKNESENSIKESMKKVRCMDPNDLLELVAEEGFLQSIKILCDWMTGETSVLKECGNSSQLLLKQIVQLLNLINIESSHRKIKNIKISLSVIQRDFEKIPLPEDVILKGIPVLKTVQDKIDWNYLNNYIVEPKEEALFRINKLFAFGNFLTDIADTGVSFDRKKKCFNIESVPIKEQEQPEITESEPQDDIIQEKSQPLSRGKLMKHMGQLWLAAEIQDLESRVQCRAAFSPYLVLDVDTLISYMHLAKQLVSARKFIVLVPIVVLSALDELKHDTKAREAIRWLEMQFHRGNRFLRAQRPQERSSIPLIKYPKKKDKETYMFIQIIECCHFLTQQQKGATNLVSLLTGNVSLLSLTEAREISYTGLAQSAGVNIELITSFITKWKKSMKGNRTQTTS